MTVLLPARDLVDVRLAAAVEAGGCPVCGVRSRAEWATLEAILAERVLDIGFRTGLERDHAFCRRHVAALIDVDRRRSGILGSSILFGAIIDRRLRLVRDAAGVRGRARRNRLATAARRPPCQVCDQGSIAVETAIKRLVDRSVDADWAEAASAAEFCIDDLIALAATAGDEPAFAPVLERQIERFADVTSRLDAYADHSAQDRRHLMTDDEARAADEAARALGGTDRRA